MSNCKNCNTVIKVSLLSSNNEIVGEQSSLINEYGLGNSESYCNKCGNNLLDEAKRLLQKEKNQINTDIQKISKFIPIISISSPTGWQYDVIDLITAQSTTGTGFISELSGSFNDFWGTQSKTINGKLRLGENNCKNQLRTRCILEGGNAVIGVDIDYSELGGEKGLLMVCMAGTAIKVKNIEIFENERKEAFLHVDKLRERIEVLSKYENM